MKTRLIIVFMGGVVTTFLYLSLMGAGGVVESPTGVAPDRYVYYPGTEELVKDEIR